MRRRGFTIVEVITASVIVALVAGAATLVIARAAAVRDVAVARAEAAGRAALAVETIARDVRNAARESDPAQVRVAVGEEPGGSTLLVRCAGTRRVRPPLGDERPEGPTHTVQYRVEAGGAGAAASGAGGGGTLWRRADPLPNEYQDAGGVAAPVAEEINGLVIEAGDGETWNTQWDSDTDGLPHAVRITVTAGAAAEGNVRSERTATARMVVALDRTPLPTGPLALPAAGSAPGAAQPAQPTQQQQPTQEQAPATGTFVVPGGQGGGGRVPGGGGGGGTGAQPGGGAGGPPPQGGPQPGQGPPGQGQPGQAGPGQPPPGGPPAAPPGGGGGGGS